MSDTLDSERTHPLVQIGPLHPQRARGLRHIPVGSLERLEDLVAFSSVPGLVEGRLGGARAGSDAYFERDDCGLNGVTRRKDGHALDDVAQFADIARPVVSGEQVKS